MSKYFRAASSSQLQNPDDGKIRHSARLSKQYLAVLSRGSKNLLFWSLRTSWLRKIVGIPREAATAREFCERCSTSVLNSCLSFPVSRRVRDSPKVSEVVELNSDEPVLSRVVEGDGVHNYAAGVTLLRQQVQQNARPRRHSFARDNATTMSVDGYCLALFAKAPARVKAGHKDGDLTFQPSTSPHRVAHLCRPAYPQQTSYSCCHIPSRENWRRPSHKMSASDAGISGNPHLAGYTCKARGLRSFDKTEQPTSF